MIQSRAGWMTALLGCVHYDMQEHEEAETALQIAQHMAKEANEPDLLAWTYEMAAWFALVENRYEDVIEAADVGLQVKEHRKCRSSAPATKGKRLRTPG